MSSAPEESVRVLYVEDAYDEALLVRTFLSALTGSFVAHAQDGDRAIELLRNQEWDILVSDLNLPGTDGFEVIRVARTKFPDIPILAVTGYAQEHYWDHAFRAGADQVMIKPLDRDDFLGRVRSMLRTAREPEAPATEAILAIEGHLGDAAMGCGGTLMLAIGAGTPVVVVPLSVDSRGADPAEHEAARLSSQILGAELRMADSLFGDAPGQTALVERVIKELKPSTIYVPALDDSEPSRTEASRIAGEVARPGTEIIGYQTATTGLEFRPDRFVDIGEKMVLKMEAVGIFQSLGAERADLRLRMVQAYAWYWGRFENFTEAEAFETIREGSS